MNALMYLWTIWAHLFHPLPYGDPWLASIGLVIGVIMMGKMVKTVMEYV